MELFQSQTGPVIGSIVIGYGRFRLGRVDDPTLLDVDLNHSLAMQGIFAFSPARNGALRTSLRTFASSAARSQAVPTERQTLMKEFKIYRWVSTIRLFHHVHSHLHQNPDEPEKKPTLQSYTIDLNQTGPMACIHSRFRL